jgi:hypothetical protein
MSYRRAWDGDAWQAFALRLVQLRHRPQNVQIVPDTVRGDAGIEFFSTDGCLYQCYAPQEVSDVAKAASAMKEKARRDLRKFITYNETVSNILQTVRAERWILLCPFLDDKGVVAYVRGKGIELKDDSLPFVSAGFEALVQSQEDFATELEALRIQSLGPPLAFDRPSDAEVAARSDSDIGKRLTHKLARAYPEDQPLTIEHRAASHIRAHLIRENALDALRLDHAVLWERSLGCLTAEENRMLTIGAGSGVPSDQLAKSVNRIEESLRTDLPDLARATITEIATGTISDWLIRCPLDFPEN